MKRRTWLPVVCLLHKIAISVCFFIVSITVCFFIVPIIIEIFTFFQFRVNMISYRGISIQSDTWLPVVCLLHKMAISVYFFIVSIMFCLFIVLRIIEIITFFQFRVNIISYRGISIQSETWLLVVRILHKITISVCFLIDAAHLLRSKPTPVCFLIASIKKQTFY